MKHQERLVVGGDIIVISFDAVKAALQFMVAGKINVDLECNPLLGPMVSEIIEKLEAGKEVGKHSMWKNSILIRQ